MGVGGCGDCVVVGTQAANDVRLRCATRNRTEKLPRPEPTAFWRAPP
jgi:hypothetical protein